MNSGIAEMLRTGVGGGSASDPVGALAQTSAAVSARALNHSWSDQQEPNIAGAAAFMGMTEVVGELASVAEEIGVYDYSQQEVDAAAIRAGEMFYAQTQQTGAFPQDEMQRDVRQMQNESNSGVLDAEIQSLAGM